MTVTPPKAYRKKKKKKKTHLRCYNKKSIIITKQIFTTLVYRVCKHVIAVYSENKLQHYATAYRNRKSAGEKLFLVS